MHAQTFRVTDQAESCLVSPVHPSTSENPDSAPGDDLEFGIVDLYARRMAMVAEQHSVQRQKALEQIVVTQPFGRPFTAQPSFPPDPSEVAGGLTGMRKRLASVTSNPRRKLATS